MKKFIKLVSLSLAAALVFGMSVSAAGSSETNNNPPQIIIPDGMTEEEYGEWQLYFGWMSSAEYVDWSRNYTSDLSSDEYWCWKHYDSDLTLTEYKAFLKETEVYYNAPETVRIYTVTNTDTKETIEKNVNENATKNAIKTQFNDPRYAEVVKVFNLYVEDGKGGEVTIEMPNALAHETYYVVHFDNYKDMNIKEIIPTTVKDGFVTFTVKDGSPFAIVKMDPTRSTFNEAGEDREVEAASNATTEAPAATTAPGTSPKTGEAVPVAGILAVILMAGAIVCANRVRYNK